MMDNASWDFLLLEQESWAWISRPPSRSFLITPYMRNGAARCCSSCGSSGCYLIKAGNGRGSHRLEDMVWKRSFEGDILAAQIVLHFPPKHCPWKYWSSKKNSFYRRRHSCSTLLLPKHWHGFAAVRRTHVGGDIFLAALYFPPKHWHGIAAVMNSYLS